MWNWLVQIIKLRDFIEYGWIIFFCVSRSWTGEKKTAFANLHLTEINRLVKKRFWNIRWTNEPCFPFPIVRQLKCKYAFVYMWFIASTIVIVTQCRIEIGFFFYPPKSKAKPYLLEKSKATIWSYAFIILYIFSCTWNVLNRLNCEYKTQEWIVQFSSCVDRNRWENFWPLTINVISWNILFTICWLARCTYCSFLILWIVNDVNQKCYVFRKIELIQRVMDMDNGYTNDVAIIDWLQFKIDFCMRIPNAEHWMTYTVV